MPHYASILSSFYHSPLLSMNLSVKPYLFFLLLTSCSHTHAYKCAPFMQNNNSYLPSLPHPSLFPSFSISHSLSCNSILMGFIGLAIHLSAAAQFNYIREPSGLSPDNLQHSPPSHKQTHLRAPSRIHTHKIQFPP